MSFQFSGSGYFKVDAFEENYYGNLFLTPLKDRILLDIEIKNTGSPLSYLTLPLKMDYITGELANGAKLTLYKCRRTGTRNLYGSRDVFTYQALFIFEGILIPDIGHDRLSQVNFKVPDILLWGDISFYKIDEDNYSLAHNPKCESMEIYSDDNYSIEYMVSGTMLPFHDSNLLVQEIKLIQEPYIIIKSKGLRSFEYFLTKYKEMKEFIEIAIKKEINPAEIIAFSSNHIYKHDKIKHELPIKVYGYIIKEKDNENNKIRDRLDYLFSLNDLLDYGDISKYIENEEKLEPIIDLYLDIIYSIDITVVRAFLNITQALETYHSRFKFNGSIAEFKKRINETILKKRANCNNVEDIKFLMANSKKFVTLESRLAELLLAEFEIHFYTGDIEFEDFSMKISKTRNYFTHYDEKLRSEIVEKEDLLPYVNILISILEYYILYELGFSDCKFRGEKVRGDLNNIKNNFIISNLAKKNINI